MRGTLWTLAVAGVGGGLLLRALNVGVPSSPTGSTDAVASVLETTAPFAGQLLAVAAIGTLLLVAMKIGSSSSGGM